MFRFSQKFQIYGVSGFFGSSRKKRKGLGVQEEREEKDIFKENCVFFAYMHIFYYLCRKFMR